MVGRQVSNTLNWGVHTLRGKMHTMFHEPICLVTVWITVQPPLLAERGSWPRVAGCEAKVNYCLSLEQPRAGKPEEI